MVLSESCKSTEGGRLGGWIKTAHRFLLSTNSEYWFLQPITIVMWSFPDLNQVVIIVTMMMKVEVLLK